VVNHLRTALQLGTDETQPVCDSDRSDTERAAMAAESELRGRKFLDGYAYCEVVGPHGHLRHPDVAMGLLLLGPHITYPEHAHPAAEIYAVVAGRAEWLQGSDLA
jgi:hypothetical protein